MHHHGYVAELHKAHKERLNRFKKAAAKAVAITVDEADDGRVAVLNASWADRQREIPLPEPDWFSVIGEVSVKPRASIRLIQIAAGKYFGVEQNELLSVRRHKKVVYARQIVMYLAKTLTSLSFPEIGRRVGGRDHSTVLYAIRKMDALVRSDQRVADDVARVKALL